MPMLGNMVRVIVVSPDAGARCAVMALIAKELGNKKVLTTLVPFDNNEQLVSDLTLSVDNVESVLNENGVLVSITEALPVPTCVEQVVADTALEKPAANTYEKPADQHTSSRALSVNSATEEECKAALEKFTEESAGVHGYIVIPSSSTLAYVILTGISITRHEFFAIIAEARKRLLGSESAKITNDTDAEKVANVASVAATKFIQERCKLFVSDMDEVMKVNIWVRDPDPNDYKFSIDILVHGSNYALFKARQSR